MHTLSIYSDDVILFWLNLYIDIKKGVHCVIFAEFSLIAAMFVIVHVYSQVISRVHVINS